jgi:hypothetical protein
MVSSVLFLVVQHVKKTGALAMQTSSKGVAEKKTCFWGFLTASNPTFL